MKKLLALILCVMMFVSIIPSAFALENVKADATTKNTDDTWNHAAVEYYKDKDGNLKLNKGMIWQTGPYPTIDNPLMNVATYAKEISNMIKNTKANIQDAYGELVGNKVVYSTAKGMDDTIVGMVDAIASGLIGKKIVTYGPDGKITNPQHLFTKNDADAVKAQVRLLIDGLVSKNMADNTYKYVTKYNDDGTIKEIDPIKYAQVFSQAVSDALTNKDFQKGYEAVATYFALSSLVKDVNDKMKDEYQDFYNSVDKDFDKDFQKNYPALWTQYIDTLTDAASGLYILDDPWATQTEYPVPVDNGWFSNVHENNVENNPADPVTPVDPVTDDTVTPDKPEA